MSVVDRINGALRHVPVGPLYLLGFAPAAIYFWLALQNRLGADPVKALEHEYGLLALQLLIAALAVTPLRELTRVNLLRFRRWLGLMAYYYVLMHVTVWLVLDRQLAWPQVVEDLTKRPYIIVGMAAAILLTPLALTSSNAGGGAFRLAGQGLAVGAAALCRSGRGAARLSAAAARAAVAVAASGARRGLSPTAEKLS